MTPRNVKSRKDLQALKDTVQQSQNFWWSLGAGYIVIRNREESKQLIAIPLHVFNRIVDWYNTGSKSSKKRKSSAKRKQEIFTKLDRNHAKTEKATKPLIAKPGKTT